MRNLAMADFDEVNYVEIENTEPGNTGFYSRDPSDIKSAKELVLLGQDSKRDVDFNRGYGILHLWKFSKNSRKSFGTMYFQWPHPQRQFVPKILSLIASVKARNESLTTVSMRQDGASESEIAKFKK